jgi:lipocalin-like protein
VNAAILAAGLLLSASSSAAGDKLWGTWRLVSFTRTYTESGQTVDAFGKEPQGFITYGRDGRMSVFIVKSGRPKVADVATIDDATRIELFKTMLAYGGTYTFDGKTVTHHIEISSNESWTGTDQIRNVKLDGRKLVLTTNPQTNATDGKMTVAILTWERVAPTRLAGRQP